jgi:hypothetical protein
MKVIAEKGIGRRKSGRLAAKGTIIISNHPPAGGNQERSYSDRNTFSSEEKRISFCKSLGRSLEETSERKQ